MASQHSLHAEGILVRPAVIDFPEARDLLLGHVGVPFTEHRDNTSHGDRVILMDLAAIDDAHAERPHLHDEIEQFFSQPRMWRQHERPRGELLDEYGPLVCVLFRRRGVQLHRQPERLQRLRRRHALPAFNSNLGETSAGGQFPDLALDVGDLDRLLT